MVVLRMRVAVIFVLLGLSTSACSKRCDYMTTDGLAAGRPDEFRVFDNTDGREQRPLKQSMDTTEIEALIAIVENAHGKWRIDTFGVPVGQYRVVFYVEGNQLVSFSFGNRFIVAQGCNYFAAANIPANDDKTLTEITGVDPEKRS